VWRKSAAAAGFGARMKSPEINALARMPSDFSDSGKGASGKEGKKQRTDCGSAIEP
jgi:hypothetical protein